VGVLDGLTSLAKNATALGQSGAANVLTHTAEVIGGAAEAGAKNVATTAQRAAADAAADPLGTAAGVLVAVSAAPAAVIVAPTVLSAAGLAYGGAALTDATGLTHGARAELEKDARWLAEHPAEASRAVAGAELLVAGAFAGGGVASKIGGALGNVISPGGAAPLPPAASKPAPKITPPKPGASHTLAPSGLSAVPGASAAPSSPPPSDWPGLFPWLAAFFRGER
jgi:hypothetical protein